MNDMMSLKTFDFLITLGFGLAVGFVIGGFFGSWFAEREKKKKVYP